MIKISHLSKKFNQFTAVDNLSFSIEPGEVLGFLGPNGAGKSTTMKMITGFLAPDEGSVTVFDHDIGSDPLAVKSIIGYLPEGAPSYGDMTVLQFLKFIAKVRLYQGAELSQRINQVVSQLQLEGVLHQVIETLSKGYKRRVGLAQAILHDPRVLILDEPTDGLDPNQKQQVRELIRNLSKDKIVIISTHILEEVSAVCSRAIIINQGKIVADGSPAELRSQSRFFRAVTLQLDGVDDAADSLKAINGVSEVECSLGGDTIYTLYPEEGKEIFSAVNNLIQDKGWRIKEFHVDHGRLEDVFQRVTGGAL